MENQVKENQHDAIKDEDFPDEFQCCVCLDLLYKPVVLACGHLACFWCIYKAMNFYGESHCPVCRQPYNHFPRSCRLLHFLLQKLYPSSYERREKQVSEEEQRTGNVSQQFDNHKSDSHLSKEFPASVAPKSDSAGGGPSSESSRTVIPEDKKTTITMTSSSGTAIDASMRQDDVTKDEFPNGTCKQVVASDLTCAICKQLLCRPVVLNCGDVYCEACIIDSSDKVCKCPVCQIPHPNGFPNVCLVLEHFLEEQLPEEYAARKKSSLKQVNPQVSPLISPTKNKEQDAQGSSVPTNVYSSWWSGRGPKVHIAVGCDYCGMCPIIGERYRCKDCKEQMGFDLCKGCYNSSCKFPGRFNQQHTEDHQFEIMEPHYLDHIILSVGAVSIGEHGLNNQNLLLMPEGVHSEEIGSNDMQEQEEGSPTSNSTYHGPEDVGDSAETPVIIVDTSEDEGTDPRT